MTLPAPERALRITASYHWGNYMLASFRPKATINGREVPLAWGANVLPAQPGRYEVSVHIPYLWTFGRATTTVDTTVPGTVVFYAAPAWTWQRGAIGVVPQRPPGLTAAWIVLGLFIAVIFAGCVAAALFNASASRPPLY